MKDKSRLIRTVLVILLLVFMFAYKYSNKVEYICLVSNTYKGTKITEDMIDLCTSRGRVKDKYITKEYDIVNKCLNTNKKMESLIYFSDIEICEDDRKITNIDLTDELKYYNHIESSYDKEIYDTFYIKDNMLYVRSDDNKEDKLLFNQEEIDKIAKRHLSPTGDSRILILTKSGNVYISEKDPSYAFDYNKDFYFWKLKVSNIIGFELINDKEDNYQSELYGITKDNKSIRIDEDYK